MAGNNRACHHRIARDLSSSPPGSSSLAPFKSASSKRDRAVSVERDTNVSIEYPDLKPWLEALDTNRTRNKHGEIFSQYGSTLVDTHKLYTIEDITSLTSQELAAVAGMDFGMASRIIRFAKDDAALLERKAKRKTHY